MYSICRFVEVLSPQNNWVRKLQKLYGLQIANQQIATFSEFPQI
jgi:hypothetical protein